MRMIVLRRWWTLLFCALGCLPPFNAARSEGILNFDKEFGTVSGWKVGFSADRSGCLAAAAFDNDTTFWVGYTGEKNAVFVAFTNPNWISIEPEGGYDIQIRTTNGGWKGKFYGFARQSEKGIYSVGLKDEFVQDLAASRNMRLYVNRKQFFSPSLGGLRDALKAVISCQNKYVEAASDTARGKNSDEKAGSSGTGFFVTNKGHVLTNNHVIEGCSAINVAQTGSPSTRAGLIARDKTNDLAILKTDLEATAVPFLRPQVRVGESISVYGFPLSGLLSTSGNFTVGSVTAVTGLADDTRMFQISAPVQPGNSGGPVVDKAGNVTGVIVSKLNALNVAAITQDIPQNVNFAIKAGIAINFLSSNDIVNVGTEKTTPLPPENIAELGSVDKFDPVTGGCEV